MRGVGGSVLPPNSSLSTLDAGANMESHHCVGHRVSQMPLVYSLDAARSLRNSQINARRARRRRGLPAGVPCPVVHMDMLRVQAKAARMAELERAVPLARASAPADQVGGDAPAGLPGAGGA